MTGEPAPALSKAFEFSGPRLVIAGLGVGLASPDPGLLDQLLPRYRAYLDAMPVLLQLTIRHRPDQGGRRRPEPEAIFIGRGVRFEEPVFQGEIDLARGRADLVVKTPDPLPEVEYFLRVIYALLAFEAGGLLFHAAGLVQREEAYLFFGPSGVGKTTAARTVSEKYVLNDDLVLLRPLERAWQAYATPFWNPSQVPPSRPLRARLKGMFRLIQSQTTFLAPLTPGQAVAELVANAPLIAADPNRSLALLARAQQLSRAVPPRQLHLRLGDDFWPLVLAAPV